jgi:hypothetical protein
MKGALDFIIERKLIVDEHGDDVTGAHSTRHRVRATNTIEALAAFATSVNGEILGSIKPRGPGAAAIIEADHKVYRLIVVPVP